MTQFLRPNPDPDPSPAALTDSCNRKEGRVRPAGKRDQFFCHPDAEIRIFSRGVIVEGDDGGSAVPQPIGGRPAGGGRASGERTQFPAEPDRRAQLGAFGRRTLCARALSPLAAAVAAAELYRPDRRRQSLDLLGTKLECRGQSFTFVPLTSP